MFVSLGFEPLLPELLCQFCVLSALMPVSTNSLKVTNSEDSLLKKLTNPQANKKNQPKNLYCCHRLLTQWVAHQAWDPAVWLEYIIMSQ